MTISKDKIVISTLNSTIALIIGIGSIFAIFYNSKADAEGQISNLSERLARVETVTPLVEKRLDSLDKRLETMQGLLQTFISQNK